MSPDRIACDVDAIDRYLSDTLDGTELARFEHHLTGCSACQDVLRERAAEPSWWDDAREFLKDSHLGSLVGSGTFRDAAVEVDGQAAQRDAILRYLAPTDDPRMVGRIGGYEIVGIIGQGGMGIVFKGFDVALNRYVAIKVLAPHLASSAAARERFAREARAAAAVVHENVVAIYGVAEHQRLPYLVMPYVRGASLQRRLDDRGALSLSEILRIALQCAAGLAAAHAQGLVHRDIKPANILLGDGVERIKITDFGLARAVDDATLTHSGVIAGTPQFMSPEQAVGDPIDHRSDLFSLGSVMYAMCTGHPPFRAETSLAVLRRITDTRPRPIRELNPEIPPWFCAIVEKLHAHDVNQRFGSAEELQNVLQQCLAHVQSHHVPLPGWLCDCSRKDSRQRTPIYVSLVVAMITILAIPLAGMLPTKQPEGTQGGHSETHGVSTVAEQTEHDVAVEQILASDPQVAWDDDTGVLIDQLNADLSQLTAEFDEFDADQSGESGEQINEH